MTDDDEIRKIIQATGGGEYSARLGEYLLFLHHPWYIVVLSRFCPHRGVHVTSLMEVLIKWVQK